MRLREHFGVSQRRQAQLSRLMQLMLVGFLFVGIYELDVGIIVNTAIGLSITMLPALLERDYEIHLDAGLTLWITAAVFLHAFGTIGLPWMETSFYQQIDWWDHLTHALSASIVAGAGYATVRVLQEHTEDIRLPPTFRFIFIVVLVIAFGVMWEVVEFVIAEGSHAIGADPVLTQYGVSDTMLDLIFNSIGAILVGIFGTTKVTVLADAIRGHRVGNNRESE